MEKLKCFFLGVITALLVVLVIVLWPGETEQNQAGRYAIAADGASLWILDTKTGIAKSLTSTGHSWHTISYNQEK